MIKVVATSDTHFPFDNKLIPDGDVFIHAGDLMYTGYVDEWYSRLESLEALPHKVKILVPGNHDLHIAYFNGPARQELRKAGVFLLDAVGNRRITELPNGMTVGGLPFVTNLEGWAYNSDESYIANYTEGLGRCDIIVSHSPPAGILDGGRGASYGIGAYRGYLSRFQPKYWISGHIHESYGVEEKQGCKFYNVAMCDKHYEQVNPAMVIELE